MATATTAEGTRIWAALCAADSEQEAESAEDRAQADEEKAEAERDEAEADRTREGRSRTAKIKEEVQVVVRERNGSYEVDKQSYRDLRNALKDGAEHAAMRWLSTTDIFSNIKGVECGPPSPKVVKDVLMELELRPDLPSIVDYNMGTDKYKLSKGGKRASGNREALATLTWQRHLAPALREAGHNPDNDRNWGPWAKDIDRAENTWWKSMGKGEAHALRLSGNMARSIKNLQKAVRRGRAFEQELGLQYAQPFYYRVLELIGQGKTADLEEGQQIRAALGFPKDALWPGEAVTIMTNRIIDKQNAEGAGRPLAMSHEEEALGSSGAGVPMEDEEAAIGILLPSMAEDEEAWDNSYEMSSEEDEEPMGHRRSAEGRRIRTALGFPKTALLMDFFSEWENTHTDGVRKLKLNYRKVLKNAEKAFKRGGWKLDLSKSFLDHYNHGSDGARMEGELVFEDLSNDARGTRETEDWLEANIGLSYNLKGRGYGRWTLDITDN